MKPLCIVNPKAGSGRGKLSPEALLKTVEDALGSVDGALTNHPRHATELAYQAALEDRELVIATGGDGSIHEVVNGLMKAQAEGHRKTTLGVIGRGTGSDFCKSLGLEPRLDRFLSVIASGHSTQVDVGRFRYADPPRPGENATADHTAYFINILSAGMGGLVDKFVHESAAWLGGTAGYFWASTKALLHGQVGVLRLTYTLDGKETVETVKTRQIAICNGRYFGSGMHVAPMAQLSDGVFDVVDLGAAAKLKFAMDSSAIYKGKHLNHPQVRHFRCQKLRLSLLNEEAQDVFLNDADGEPLGGLPLEIEVLPKALSVLTPPPG